MFLDLCLAFRCSTSYRKSSNDLEPSLCSGLLSVMVGGESAFVPEAGETLLTILVAIICTFT